MKNKMLVLLPDLFNCVGGIQTFNRCLVKALSELSIKHKFELVLNVLNDNKDYYHQNSYIDSAKIKVSCFKRNKATFILSSIFNGLACNWIILGHINFLPITMALHKNLSLIVYGVDVWEKLSWLKKVAILKISNIVSISNFTKNKMQFFNKTPDSKFKLLPCTLDPFYAQNIKLKSREELNLPNGKIILTVSRLGIGDEYKNIHLIIESMPEILKAVPDSFLVIVGDGNDKKRLEDLALTLNLKDKIIFTGRVSDDLLPSYYNACDIFSLPSLKEGFGIVFLEAMYFNKPCVGANAGGIPEVIEHGKTGFLAIPNDTESLTKYLITLLKDNDLRNKMGKSGKERLEKEFSFDCFKNRLEKILINSLYLR